jgi:type II secretory pathway pseudopilin PulG
VSIIEMMVVLAVSAILTLVTIQEDVAKRHTQMLTAEGYNEAAIVNALQTYLTEQQGTMLAGVNGGAPIAAPALSALNLKNNYAASPFWGGTYTIALTVSPATCTALAGNCHIAYQFYPSTPYTKNGVANISDVAQIVSAANSHDSQFGYSNTATKTLSNGLQSGPAYITGIGGAWSVANPLGSQAGTIMATNNGGSSDTGMLYVRRDGSLVWTGSQDVGGVNLNNVGTVNAGTVNTSGLNVSGTSNLGTANATTLTTTGNTKVGGNLTVAGTIQAGAVGYPRAACSPLGAQASNLDGRGQQLSCENLNDGAGAVWIPVGGPTQVYNFYQVAHGSVVPSPSCFAGGTPQIRLLPQTFQVDTTAAVNYAGPGSGPWTILITNGSGSSTSNVNGGAIGTGEVETYCSY